MYTYTKQYYIATFSHISYFPSNKQDEEEEEVEIYIENHHHITKQTENFQNEKRSGSLRKLVMQQLLLCQPHKQSNPSIKTGEIYKRLYF